jgi:hypothetical protein
MALTRTSTNSWINDKYPTLISIAKIRPTNLYSNKPKNVSKLPIMLVEGGDGFFYIADGNHRFFNKLVSNDDSQKNMLAWILSENEKKLVLGGPLPKYIKEWVEGKITLSELTNLAISSFKEIEGKISGLIEYYLGIGDKLEPQLVKKSMLFLKRKIPQKTNIINEVNYAKDRAFNISQAILKIFRGNTSLQKEIEILDISIEDFSSFQKCFVDGGINAIYERIRKDE